MPELPEVEVVRRGLSAWIIGQQVNSVEVLGQRSVRRQTGGSDEFIGRLTGRRIADVCRRGKYLWFRLDDEQVVLAHLGMSGQMLLKRTPAPDEKHLRIRLVLDDLELRFVDQRTFGGMCVEEAANGLPVSIGHIARDPLDSAFDLESVSRRIRSKRSGIKRVLLDQTTISGIGNIYADEALWRSRIHWNTPAERLSAARARELICHADEVMRDALLVGGTSFDSLYVNVNGESGYFDRSLDVYGRAGKPCRRCGTTIVREEFMNRSSYRCPRCQRRPRLA